MAALVAALSLLPVLAPDALAARAAQKKGAQPTTVYDKQPPVTDKELVGFLEILPRFRAWAKESKEEAHPVLRNGKADFLYSPQATEWVRTQGWDPVRFFCVMGRMAAALVIVEEGNDMSGTRPRDMPGVTEEELALARRHLGTMLKAGGDAPPINR
ncbi:serine/threonine protein phosphatase [uncultured Desulfovibrio sp.]|uniref:serine/threonine protein phosphatase n=1 Tax=uncultured Desulfovibrio sp. TaxID=167968 RepID=UPI002619670D|nr:serine/threonine protein phosphatase [uncultured Desulfovibrio sp.]